MRLPLLALLLTTALLRAEEPVNTVVTSTNFEMTSTDTELRAIFSGNVKVTGTNLQLTCDRVEILASRFKDKSTEAKKIDQFKSLIATGNVRILQGEREATCGRAEVLPREDKVVLTQQPTVIDHTSDTIAVGEPLILYRGEQRIQGDNIRITFRPIKDLGSKAGAAPSEAPKTP